MLIKELAFSAHSHSLRADRFTARIAAASQTRLKCDELLAERARGNSGPRLAYAARLYRRGLARLRAQSRSVIVNRARPN